MHRQLLQEPLPIWRERDCGDCGMQRDDLPARMKLGALMTANLRSVLG